MQSYFMMSTREAKHRVPAYLTAKHLLLCYFNIVECRRSEETIEMLAKKVLLMLDSGAYSAWAQKKEIDIDAYIAFIKKHRAKFSSYVNLDVIPGEVGDDAVRRRRAMEASAKKSYVNLLYMKKRGLSPMPVFHQGEDFKWLRRMLDDGEPYVGLSPTSNLTTTAIRHWLDQCFTIVTDEKGKPLVKTHGFGIAAPRLLVRYPWTTCDSAGFVMKAMYGVIYVPYFDGERFRFDHFGGGCPHLYIMTHGVPRNGDARPEFVATPTREQMNGGSRRYDRLGASERRVIKFWLAHCGVTVREVRLHWTARLVAMIKFYQLAEACAPDRFAYRVDQAVSTKRFF
jgi:hypothetical protein